MTTNGDSATTDASLLGKAAHYMGGSHYMIQPHDDTEHSVNDHEDTNSSKDSFRGHGIYPPTANVARTMKNVLPQMGEIVRLQGLCSRMSK